MNYKSLFMSDCLLLSIFYNRIDHQLFRGMMKDAVQTSAYKVVFNNEKNTYTHKTCLELRM